MGTSIDGSESVDQFLARIASLSQKDDEAEAARTRRMEEEMMQARRERRARREERARSISPVKTGPTTILSSSRALPSPPEKSLGTSVSLAPCSQTQTPVGKERDRSLLPPISVRSPPLDTATKLPPSPQSEKPLTPTFPPTNTTTLSRHGTLSWQQRPNSREGLAVRSRPISGPRTVVSEIVEKPIPPKHEPDMPQPSRAEIATSLGARDSSFFRQTADRGLHSAAYRKSDNEAPSKESQSWSGMRLPGMGEVDKETEKQHYSPLPAVKPVTILDGNGPGSILVADPVVKVQPFKPSASGQISQAQTPHLDIGSPKDGSGSPSRNASATTAAGRPLSPTKGLGGFVQSAMMKRSDSVSKRWNVQANAGLKRGDSVAGNKLNTLPQSNLPSLGPARAISRDARFGTGEPSSPMSTSRPTSSYVPEATASLLKSTESLSSSPLAARPTDITSSESLISPDQDSLLSRSPSKTLDPRRWSPTKASWLESALSKPDSPRSTATKPEPPAWKMSLERSRSQNRIDRSPNRATSFEASDTDDLPRSSPSISRNRPHKSVAASSPSEATEGLGDGRDEKITPPKPEKPSTLPKRTAESSVKTDTPSPPPQDSRPEQQAASTLANENSKNPPLLTSQGSLMDVTGLGGPASAETKPSFLKQKPQTPPKIDLRAGLRTRQIDTSGGETAEPEFKAVFGKLKRTQTQNYVAPDVLKDNITRGKAALVVTGGPQQTRRVDEFKESIIQRRKDMKPGTGLANKPLEIQTSRDNLPEAKAVDVPEALARRKTLHSTKQPTSAADDRSGIHLTTPVATKLPTTTSPDTEVKAKDIVPSTFHSADKEPVLTPVGTKADSGATNKSVSSINSLRDRTLGAETRLQEPEEKAHILPATKPSSSDDDPSPDEGVTKNMSNGLAGRLNVNLAAIIARGSALKSGGDMYGLGAGVAKVMPSSISPTPESQDLGSLTHLTKGRAKGPKRRTPKLDGVSPAQTAFPDAGKVGALSQSIVGLVGSGRESNPAAQTDAPAKSDKASHGPRLATSLKPSLADEPTLVPSRQISPPASKTLPISESEPVVKKDKPEIASKAVPPTKNKPVMENTKISPPELPRKPLSFVTDNAPLESNLYTTPRSGQLRHSTASSAPLTPSKTRVNSPQMQSPAIHSPGPKPTARTGLGLALSPPAKQTVVSAELTPPPDKALPPDNEIDQVFGLEAVLREYFDSVPKASDRLEFDAEAFLKDQSFNSRDDVKTVCYKIVEVTGDGKQSPMLAGQDHIFYEDRMYLCIHSFEVKSSKSTEVYLWAGDGVPDAGIDDAQIFCKKVAKDNSTKLEVIKQGKEPARLLAALGGILIIQKSASRPRYILCGRRNGAHVVFDEVDYAASSLCSAFSYLVSANSGKLYLWIGQGSCADEYGAARLVGASLGLTGEVEEVIEGQEPVAFWEIFSTSEATKDVQRSETWSLRSSSEHHGFPSKLYRVEQERPKSSGGFWGLRSSSPPKSTNKVNLVDISPFTQHDLNEDHVFLLDAYASIYVIPGSSSSSKTTDFVSAMHIAQELAVLLPSIQDRALLPSCFVVFGEPPQQVKTVFRKWQGPARGDGHLVEVAELMKVLG